MSVGGDDDGRQERSLVKQLTPLHYAIAGEK
jgi:hypothetical protein